MELFQLSRAPGLAEAIRDGAASNTAQQGAQIRYLAGGTTLVDLMKLNVERPAKVIDISRLPLDQVEVLPNGGLQIGAMVRNSDLAQHPAVLKDYAVLSQALLSGASAQLRNKATTGGNLLQRTRCVYFRDTAMPCNKRQPESGCSAIGGFNRAMAVLGTSDHCIATNPSDMNVALMALDANIHISGVTGGRVVEIDRFFLLPGATPQVENVMQPGDIVTHVSLGKPASGSRSLYLKLRDRAAYEFALASAAVVISLAHGRIVQARIALGGVGTMPWRSREAEAALRDKAPSAAVFRIAAEAALQGAKPQSQNAFKIELARRCLAHALKLATEAA